EQGTEVALTEAFVALALDDLEENRADDVLREYLQQHALALARVAVDQYPPRPELLQRLRMPGHACVNRVVVSLGRVLKCDTVTPQNVHRPVDVGARQGNVLNAL